MESRAIQTIILPDEHEEAMEMKTEGTITIATTGTIEMTGIIGMTGIIKIIRERTMIMMQMTVQTAGAEEEKEINTIHPPNQSNWSV